MLVSVFCVILFFFFKQKTAYEMRISDWSSDVCSSDLVVKTRGHGRGSRIPGAGTAYPGPGGRHEDPRDHVVPGRRRARRPGACAAGARGGGAAAAGRAAGAGQFRRRARHPAADADRGLPHRASRSEEHTSELQSLMRISYAVFCLKKKNKTKKKIKHPISYIDN